MKADVVVVGGGTVGAAIGYGLAGRGQRVLVLDGGDCDFRAANANFGLVWLQGKGMNLPAYQHLTRTSVELWPEFASELTDTTSIDLQYEQQGGLSVCLSQTEFDERRAKMVRLHEQRGGGRPDWEMLDRDSLIKLLPQVAFGPSVAGASFGQRDGHANPLRLLAALHHGIIRKGGELRGASPVHSINSDGKGTFTIKFGTEHVSSARVVIAAGLGSKALAAQVGLDIPLRPLRGQILVTERVAPLLPLPMSGLRQTREGTVMIGATHDGPDLDTSTTVEAASRLSAKAILRVPALAQATLVRHWAGLRIMTPDSYPIYAESLTHPGAFVATCHSGVTLASTHAGLFADAVLDGRLPPSFDAFHQRRFDVPQAA
jgi:glycine/D-amino acid oxidase-like deaminating enzyme